MKVFIAVLAFAGLAASQNNGFRGYAARGSPSGPSFSSGSNFGGSSSGGSSGSYNSGGYSSGGSYSSGGGGGGAQIATVRLINENNGDGTYNYEYETSNKIQAQEQGQLNQDSLVVKGSYSWLAPDGQMYTVNYVADENGYHPTGSHIQGQEAIERSIKFNAQNPEPQQSFGSTSSFGGVQANRGGYSSGSSSSGFSKPTNQYLPPNHG